MRRIGAVYRRIHSGKIWGEDGDVLRKILKGKGSCDGERTFFKRTEIFFRGLGKAWLFMVQTLLPSS